MDEQEVMLNAFSKYFNKTDDELLEMLYDKGEDDALVLKEGVADMLIDLDTKRIERIRKEASESATKKFDDFAKKTKKDVMTKLESELKQKYGVESDKTGVELVEEITASLSVGGGITEDNIKTNPIYLKLEREIKEGFKGELEEKERVFNEFKDNVERNAKLGDVKKKAREVFLGLSPVLSVDAAKAERQTQEFLNRLNGHDFIIDGDTIMIKRGDGRLEDGHGNPVSFESFVKGEAEQLYDFNVQTPRTSPGNIHSSGGSKLKITKAEFNQRVREAGSDNAKLAELSKYEVVD